MKEFAYNQFTAGSPLTSTASKLGFNGTWPRAFQINGYEGTFYRTSDAPIGGVMMYRNAGDRLAPDAAISAS